MASIFANIFGRKEQKMFVGNAQGRIVQNAQSIEEVLAHLQNYAHELTQGDFSHLKEYLSAVQHFVQFSENIKTYVERTERDELEHVHALFELLSQPAKTGVFMGSDIHLFRSHAKRALTRVSAALMRERRSERALRRGRFRGPVSLRFRAMDSRIALLFTLSREEHSYSVQQSEVYHAIQQFLRQLEQAQKINDHYKLEEARKQLRPLVTRFFDTITREYEALVLILQDIDAIEATVYHDIATLAEMYKKDKELHDAFISAERMISSHFRENGRALIRLRNFAVRLNHAVSSTFHA